MKKSVTILILILIVVTFVGALYYLYQKNAEDPTVYDTETAQTTTIVKKTVATGSIVPRDEVLIKPNISGIIEEIYIEPGQLVETGDLIARLRIVPNVSNLANTRNQINTAQIALDNQKKNYDRQKALFEKGVISANEFDQAEVAFRQAEQNLIAAKQTFDIVKTGTTSGLGSDANTDIRATVPGMILEVPVKVGNQVIESNNFNEGTTIAAIADVKKMIFEGKVDESEVGKLTEELPLEITVGAIDSKVFDAVLDYIAPKGNAENGAIQFEIKGTIKNLDSTFIRAGLSANASIILDKAEDVLALKEGLIQYDSKTQQAFVEVETASQNFERREVELGLSDGIFVEIKSGISKEDKVKIWNPIVSPFANR
ncbi:efflux RND transporter periplasmic adaptor subunit [Planktosalinus lacus]|uniref:RND transporter MFP subunit n=1 Tax=Planktosalinus lacus TaxID=1526573 RepID=A0A8J2V8A7_9FLAO|nr:efflux RND transporter periplasmic adaptor subunit [Planktosalinus lacus]GGD83214.1 RND transporter MFP subunit [Planktosalinus lacus]